MPEMEGSWTMPDLNWVMSLERTGDNFYHYYDDVHDPTNAREAVFVNLESELFIDLRGILPGTLGDAGFRNSFLNALREKKGITKRKTLYINRNEEFAKLEALLRSCLDIKKIYEIIGLR